MILWTRVFCFICLVRARYRLRYSRLATNSNSISTNLQKAQSTQPGSLDSKIVAKTRRIAHSKSFQAGGIIVIVITLLISRGANSSDRTSTTKLGLIATSIVEETASPILRKIGSGSAETNPSNGFFAVNSQDPGQGGPEIFLDSSPIQESTIEAYNPANTAYLDEVSTKRSRVVEYEVQVGDVISFIASDYGVSVNSLIWANNLSNANSLSPGQILKIPPITGVLHAAKKGDTVQSLAKKYGADADKIIEFNALPKDGQLQIGAQVVIPDGKIGPVGVASTASKTQQRFSYLPDLGDFFRVPSTGFNWGSIHGRNGVDIANSCGTPIYAAAEGTVSAVDITGWNGGFGKYLKILHPNGTETLYAHATKILAKAGDLVTKDTQIALMGTTGRSTGCHLHFEVHGAKNPLAKP